MPSDAQGNPNAAVCRWCSMPKISALSMTRGERTQICRECDGGAIPTNIAAHRAHREEA